MNKLQSIESVVLPDISAKSVQHVDFEALSYVGVRNVFIDLDLTLRRSQLARLCMSSLVEYLHDNQKAGYIESITLATNSRSDMTRFAEQLGGGYIQPFEEGGERIKKPDPRFFEAVLAATCVSPGSSVMIGDRYMIDIVGAARAGMKTVLVEPLATDYPLDLIRRTRSKDRRALKLAKEAAGRKGG